MILVRETFVAKPGQASKLARLMKEVVAGMGSTGRVMTDMTGQFNTVVLETEYDGLDAFQKRMQEYQTNSVVREKMAGYTDMYQTGSREMYQVL